MFVTTTKNVTIREFNEEILISECVEVAARMAAVQLNFSTNFHEVEIGSVYWTVMEKKKID